MTRKDFELIAAVLNEARDFAVYEKSPEARAQHALTCNGMAARLGFVNPQFNRIKFLMACGLSREVADNL